MSIRKLLRHREPIVKHAFIICAGGGTGLELVSLLAVADCVLLSDALATLRIACGKVHKAVGCTVEKPQTKFQGKN